MFDSIIDYFKGDFVEFYTSPVSLVVAFIALLSTALYFGAYKSYEVRYDEHTNDVFWRFVFVLVSLVLLAPLLFNSVEDMYGFLTSLN